MSMVIETVKLAFTDEERLELGERLADAHETASIADENAKEAARERREDCEKLWGIVAGYATALRLGYREAQVECKEVFNPDTNLMDIVRVDNGDVVRSRKLRPDELTKPLPFDEEPTP